MVDIMTGDEFRIALIKLFPNIIEDMNMNAHYFHSTLNEGMFSYEGVSEICKWTNFRAYDEAPTYDEIYEHIESHKHLYEWWIL